MTALVPIAVWVFWTILILLFLNYYGLYWALRFTALLKKPKPAARTDILPRLTVFVPAHNEERVIGAKIENLLEQDYPSERLEILVGSDASTDATNQIVRDFGNRAVKLLTFDQRSGKLGMLDKVVPTLACDVVVINDANVMLKPDALRRMAEAYSEPNVGAVCGNETLNAPNNGLNCEPEINYRRNEAELKQILGRFGIVIGAFGGFYSIRRSLFRPIGPVPGDDDLILPMEALAQQCRVVFAEEALSFEEVSPRIRGAFRRRVRLTGYNLNTLGRLVRQASEAGLTVSLIVWLYKILRWFSPYLLLPLLGAVLVLCPIALPYQIAAVVAVLVAIAAAIGWALDSLGLKAPGFINAYQFVMMNVAAYVGLFHWLRGVKSFWNPVR